MSRRPTPVSTPRRDASAIANRVAVHLSDPLLSVLASPVWPETPAVRSIPLTEIEDGRTWHPDEDRFPSQERRYRARMIDAEVGSSPNPRRAVGRALQGAQLPSQRFFRYPGHVPLCERRQRRREVILATGKGGGRHRPPRRTWKSDLSC